MKHLIPRQPAPLPIVWRRHAFAEPIRDVREAGMTIAEVVRSLPQLPERFWQDGVVLVSDQPVPRHMWARVRPKPKPDGSVDVTLWLAPQGGNSRAILTLVASIALLVVAGPAGAFLAATEVGLAIGLSATVATAGVTVVGALAISALSAPPSIAALTTSGGVEPQLTPASLQGNVLRPGAALPHVRGLRKVFPPIVVKPLVELVGEDEFITAVVGLGGPHALTDLRAGGNPFTSNPDLQYEVREGHASDTAITLVTRQSNTYGSAFKMSKHDIDLDTAGGKNLKDQTTPINSAPKWESMSAMGSPDEIWLTFRWGALVDSATPTTNIVMPLRFRMRAVGATDWIYLPEVWFASHRGYALTRDIRIIFGTAPALPTPGTTDAPYLAISMVGWHVDTTIGTIGSIANAFDANPATQASTAATTSVYFGSRDTSSPRTVRYAILFPNAATGFVTTAVNVKFDLYGKNGAAPATGTDGTLLGTTGFIADTTNVGSVTSTDFTTAWDNVWVLMTTSGSTTVQVVECCFIDAEGEYSLVVDFLFRPGGLAIRHMDSSNIGTTNLANIALYDDRAAIYINTGTYPKGDYEIQAKAGSIAPIASLTAASYTLGGTSGGDYFRWQKGAGQFRIPFGVDSVANDLECARVARIWNEHPLLNAPGNMALIAFKGKNQQIGQVSALARRYVLDWNGSAWATISTTASPAAHLHDVLAGGLNGDPAPEDLIDSAGLVEWRQHCADNNYTINAVIEGASAAVTAQLAAGCGYARLRQSETFGVIIDRDRSFESAVQTFTPRNSRGYTWEKAYVRLPSGFRAIYANSADDYNETELIVLDPAGDQGARYEEIRYDGFVTTAAVQTRALFDLAQARSRMTFHSWETNAQAIKCKRGDVVAINHPVLTQQMGSGYIRSIQLSGSDIAGVILDGTVPVAGTARLGAAVRLTNGGEAIAEYVNGGSPDGSSTITFTAPMPGPIAGFEVGCLVATGLMGISRQRLIAGEIAAKDGPGFPCSILAVDEAPTLWGPPTARNIIRGLGLDDQLVLALDAGDGASFTSGQTWHDTSGQANDFWFGASSSVTTDDPTFNGTANRRTQSEFMSFDGGDFFDEITNGGWDTPWHMAGAKFTIAAIVYPVTNVSELRILANRSAATDHGFAIRKNLTTGRLELLRSNGVAVQVDTFGASSELTLNAWNFVAVSVNEAGGAVGSHWRVHDLATGTFNGAKTSPSSTIPGSKARIFASPDGTNLAAAGSRVMTVMAWNRCLSMIDTGNLFALWRTRRLP